MVSGVIRNEFHFSEVNRSVNNIASRLSMYIQGLLRNEIESLIPNDCHCGETNCICYDPNILVSTRK